MSGILARHLVSIAIDDASTSNTATIPACTNPFVLYTGQRSDDNPAGLATEQYWCTVDMTDATTVRARVGAAGSNHVVTAVVLDFPAAVYVEAVPFTIASGETASGSISLGQSVVVANTMVSISATTSGTGTRSAVNAAVDVTLTATTISFSRSGTAGSVTGVAFIAYHAGISVAREDIQTTGWWNDSPLALTSTYTTAETLVITTGHSIYETRPLSFPGDTSPSNSGAAVAFSGTTFDEVYVLGTPTGPTAVDLTTQLQFITVNVDGTPLWCAHWGAHGSNTDSTATSTGFTDADFTFAAHTSYVACAGANYTHLTAEFDNASTFGIYTDATTDAAGAWAAVEWPAASTGGGSETIAATSAATTGASGSASRLRTGSATSSSNSSTVGHTRVLRSLAGLSTATTSDITDASRGRALRVTSPLPTSSAESVGVVVARSISATAGAVTGESARVDTGLSATSESTTSSVAAAAISRAIDATSSSASGTIDCSVGVLRGARATAPSVSGDNSETTTDGTEPVSATASATTGNVARAVVGRRLTAVSPGLSQTTGTSRVVRTLRATSAAISGEVVALGTRPLPHFVRTVIQDRSSAARTRRVTAVARVERRRYTVVAK